MSGSVSISLITQAAVPGIALAAAGFAWLRWGKSFRAVGATLLSLGVALLALMSLIVLVQGTSLRHALEPGVLAALGATPLIYAASLIGCVRRGNVPAASAAAVGLAGLVPLWFIGGFVLMSAVCSFGSGGC